MIWGKYICDAVLSLPAKWGGAGNHSIDLTEKKMRLCI